jgi:SAM-dependent methyltransferase
VDTAGEPYYRADLALVHHLGFGLHADRCAEGVLALLEPVRRRGGLVLELGCGSGRLTRHLLGSGHRVVATDASPAMLALARAEAPEAEAVEQLVLPDDPLPRADAIVSVGHVLNYLPDEAAIDRALRHIATALRPEGVLVVDLCDRRWGEARRHEPDLARLEDDWALITRFSVPDPNRYVRDITTFIRRGDGAWRRDDERHVNVLIDTSVVPSMLARQGVAATIATRLGGYALPDGLVAVAGRRRAREGGPLAVGSIYQSAPWSQRRSGPSHSAAYRSAGVTTSLPERARTQICPGGCGSAALMRRRSSAPLTPVAHRAAAAASG